MVLPASARRSNQAISVHVQSFARAPPRPPVFSLYFQARTCTDDERVVIDPRPGAHKAIRFSTNPHRHLLWPAKGWWARQDSNLRQHRYEWAEKAWRTAENLGFSIRTIESGANDFNRLTLVACPLRAATTCGVLGMDASKVQRANRGSWRCEASITKRPVSGGGAWTRAALDFYAGRAGRPRGGR